MTTGTKQATEKQRRLIAILCIKLGVKEKLEDREMTTGQAGKIIRELLEKSKK